MKRIYNDENQQIFKEESVGRRVNHV